GLMLEKGWGYDTIPYENLFHYCGVDCYWTWKLAEKLEMFSEPYNKILLPLARLCAQLEITGIKIDKEWASTVHKEYAVGQTGLAKKIRRMEVVRGYVKQKR